MFFRAAHKWPFFHYDLLILGHLTGCCGTDPHSLLICSSSAQSELFPHKEEKLFHISNKAAACHKNDSKNLFFHSSLSSKTAMKTHYLCHDKFLTSIHINLLYAQKKGATCKFFWKNCVRNNCQQIA